MNFYLYKLKFTTPVHFGISESALSLYESSDHFQADTLFSALCHEALSLYGEEGIEDLISCVSNGKLLFSDSMVWSGDEFYLPKPYYIGEHNEEASSSEERKLMKKLRWIPAMQVERFLSPADKTNRICAEVIRRNFGVEDEATRVHIHGSEQSVPYQIGTFLFDDDCGLYMIAGTDDELVHDRFSILLQALSLDGIGGKTSSGYGKFVIDDEILLNEPFDEQTEWFYKTLTDATADKYILLTTALPDEDEMEHAIDGAFYQLTRRGGFIFSETYSEKMQKKDTEYYLAAGSVVAHTFHGSLHTVGSKGMHKVYRYSLPMFLGV